jgi:hypothetical protein
MLHNRKLKRVRSNEGRKWKIKLGIGKVKNSTLGNHLGALEIIGSILEAKVYTRGRIEKWGNYNQTFKGISFIVVGGKISFDEGIQWAWNLVLSSWERKRKASC